MDYEKEYKSLVAKVKKAHQFAQTDSTKSVLEDILPQLRESEDEKIRTLLVCLVQWAKTFKQSGLDSDTSNKMLSYLEKQKEQKPMEWSEGERIRQKLIHIVKKYRSMVLDGDDKAYDDCLAYLEVRKEQKPDSLTKYVYSKEDKEFIQNCSYILVANGYATSAERLLSMFEQKPEEKQDYSGLNDLERVIHRGFLSAGVENVPVKIINETAKECLEKMNPAEWSEEDEKMVRFYEADYNNQIGDMLMKDVIDMRLQFKNWLVNRLKSIRPQPHWKPSDEKKEPEYYQHFDPDC